VDAIEAVRRADLPVLPCNGSAWICVSERAARVGVRIGDHRLAPDGADHHLVKVVRFTDEGVRVALGGTAYGLECGWDLEPEDVAAWHIAAPTAPANPSNPSRGGTA
jgi:hypothetical protein